MTTKARPIRLVAALLLLAALAASCGSRVDKEKVFAAQGAASSARAASSAAGQDVTGSGSGTGSPTAANPAGGAASAASGASATGGGQTQAPAGGNGGATDVGVTADSMTLGTVATLSGPVPGVFQGAVIGSLAAVAYQNSKGGMFGRTFKLDARDDQLDTGQNRSQTIDLLGKAFAFIGSFSSFDDAAAAQIEQSGIPDVSLSLTAARRALPNNFSVSPSPRSGAPTGAFTYFKQRFPDAVKAVGSIYYDIAKNNQDDYRTAAESVGWHFAYERGIQATETDFTADVVRMRQNGVKAVYMGAVDIKAVARLAKAMAQQSFKPSFFLTTGVGYDPTVASLAGEAVDGLYNAQPYAMFGGEDAGAIPEVKLFNQWLQKVKPGYKPDLFAAYGWASGRLFFQALEAAGPKAKRADVIAALRRINEFSANGFLAPAGPGAKRPAECYILVQLKGTKFERSDSPPPGYRCNDGPYFVRER